MKEWFWSPTIDENASTCDDLLESQELSTTCPNLPRYLLALHVGFSKSCPGRLSPMGPRFEPPSADQSTARAAMCVVETVRYIRGAAAVVKFAWCRQGSQTTVDQLIHLQSCGLILDTIEPQLRKASICTMLPWSQSARCLGRQPKIEDKVDEEHEQPLKAHRMYVKRQTQRRVRLLCSGSSRSYTTCPASAAIF